MSNAVYTVTEVATLFKLSGRSVRRMITTGVLPSLKVGGAVRVRASDVDALLASAGPGLRETKAALEKILELASAAGGADDLARRLGDIRQAAAEALDQA